jgi:hypothetical protein
MHRTASECHGGFADLTLRRLWSLMTLRRSSRSRPYSCCWQFCVIYWCMSLSARQRLPLPNWLPLDGSPRWLTANCSAAITWLAASAPCWAKARRGELSGAMRWINFMMVWSRTTFKSGFRFWTNLLLGVQAYDASNLPMVGCLLELFCEGHPIRGNMMMRRPSSAWLSLVLPLISGYPSVESWSWDAPYLNELDVPVDGWKMGASIKSPCVVLGAR